MCSIVNELSHSSNGQEQPVTGPAARATPDSHTSARTLCNPPSSGAVPDQDEEIRLCQEAYACQFSTARVAYIRAVCVPLVDDSKVRAAREVYDARIQAAWEEMQATLAKLNRAKEEKIQEMQEHSGTDACYHIAKEEESEKDQQTHEERKEPRAERPPSFSVLILNVAGEERAVSGLRPDDLLMTAYEKVALEFGIPSFAVRLTLDGRLLDGADAAKSLAELGFCETSELMLLQSWGWAKPRLDLLSHLEKRWQVRGPAVAAC